MDKGIQGLTINIIYVKDTPELLLPFLSSLIFHTDCRYRLISNGCSLDDEALLKNFVQTEKRTSFFSMESEDILKHHEVLHRVLTLEQSPWFVFMDSDIIAKAPFLDGLLSALEGKQAIFTGLPVWHQQNEKIMPRKFQIMGGRYYQAHNGYLLGLSYAAIYRTEELKRFMSTTGLDFRKYRWGDIPVEYQDILISLDLKKYLYDTGKVLNVIWQYREGLMAYVESEKLIHIGGVSGKDSRSKEDLSFSKKAFKLLLKVTISMTKPILQRKGGLSIAETLNIDRLVKKRRLSEKLLVRNLSNNSTADTNAYLKMLPNEVADNIRKARPQIQHAIDVFGSKPSNTISPKTL